MEGQKSLKEVLIIMHTIPLLCLQNIQIIFLLIQKYLLLTYSGWWRMPKNKYTHSFLSGGASSLVEEMRQAWCCYLQQNVMESTRNCQVNGYETARRKIVSADGLQRGEFPLRFLSRKD